MMSRPALASLVGGRSLEELGKVARDFFTQWKTVYLYAPPTD
jgi:hypothetical protein